MITTAEQIGRSWWCAVSHPETVNFLAEVIRLIEQYPVLANHRPTFAPTDNEITWFAFWDAGKLVTELSELGWREEWPEVK